MKDSDNNTRILEYLKRMQALAKTGLTYTENSYDIERYEEIRDTTHALLSDLSNASLDEVSMHFRELDDNYPTPKIDVRAVILKNDKLLLIQERTDQKWAMPGGWCDIGYSASENVVKEVKEESGLTVKPVRLLALWDKAKHDHPADLKYIYKVNYLCKIVSGEVNVGHEALDGGFFALDNLPPLSEERNTKSQIQKLYDLVRKEQIDWD